MTGRIDTNIFYTSQSRGFQVQFVTTIFYVYVLCYILCFFFNFGDETLILGSSVPHSLRAVNSKKHVSNQLSEVCACSASNDVQTYMIITFIFKHDDDQEV